MGIWSGSSVAMFRWRNNGVKSSLLLLLDIGNTHTHLGLSNSQAVVRQANIPTQAWNEPGVEKLLLKFIGARVPTGAALCSVVPRTTPKARRAIKTLWNIECHELRATTVTGVGIRYPKPETIGPDRLANATAAHARFGAPSVVVDFGTAVTFDVVDASGNYVGGIIAPGLAAMTDYLHERTALLPRIQIRESRRVVGKSTEEAMLSGAVHGYRGLIRELIQKLKQELRVRNLPIVATGGYAKLMARKLPEITAVDPLLTLEGLRLTWHNHHAN